MIEEDTAEAEDMEEAEDESEEDLLSSEFFEFSSEDLLDLVGRIFDVSTKDSSSAATSLYDHLRKRFVRSILYYKSIASATEKLSQLAHEIGDPTALRLDHKNLDELLSKLEEVHFVRSMGANIGLEQKDLDLIVSHVISREFAPMARR